MTNVFLYYDFTDFITDESHSFSGNKICYSELNAEHFMIFEKEGGKYNLFISKYASKNDIGKKPPLILETLVKDYNKSIPEHRVILRRYFQ